ncbi:hypothetical protein IAQ61_010398 [Plenodomus lingam]|uniref:Predicted protein n=1 Tax=Leptosphaeria maculans (strain JN3 / isolate v23.1.3 / race Av1-4-5-6-7-8) TaxID=985895 RepID=E5A3T6_LEPMJ|nr:predicted protein [Plenodomus lingam JN3]KAH9862195.1 hypothetical protein IAQ61_010398 [Plenodomus lingam]CBX98299.1 predicted protein [Plenodomus lingam JN3]
MCFGSYASPYLSNKLAKTKPLGERAHAPFVDLPKSFGCLQVRVGKASETLSDRFRDPCQWKEFPYLVTEDGTLQIETDEDNSN